MPAPPPVSQGMSHFTRLFVAISAVTAAACTDEPTAPFPLAFASAQRSCGAADGPAVTILLSDTQFATENPDPPYVHVWIQQSVTTLAGKSFQLPAQASAILHRSGPAPEEATSGTVVIASVSADTTISGSVEARYGDLVVSKQFTASWRSKQILCG
jgi:hypothetical protein